MKLSLPSSDTDIAGFLRNERENALLSVIEETRRDTFEHVERMHWDAVAAEWDADKRRILQALTSATGAAPGSGIFVGDSGARFPARSVKNCHEISHGNKTKTLEYDKMRFDPDVSPTILGLY